MKLFRPLNCAFSALVTLFAFWVAGALTLSANPWWSALVMALLTAFANAHNDVVDAEIDKINLPGRPIPSGKISHLDAKYQAGIPVFLAFIVLVTQGKIDQILLCVTVFCLTYLYNRFLKKMPLIGNFMVALISTSTIGMALVLHPQNALLWTLVVFAFFLQFAREIVKDIEDLPGDSALGLRTFPIVAGISPSLSIVVTLLCAVLGYASAKLPVALLALVPCAVAFGIFAYRKNWHKAQVTLKVAMFLGMLSVASTLLVP
jgi:geranylgeranylglycerol-phosphate geranylgeranyltransferase